MSGGLSRRSAILASVAFAAALGGGYVLSSSGSAEAPAAPIGTGAVSLDVSAAAEGRPGLGDAERIPPLARRPRQAPPPPPAPPPPAPEPDEPDEPAAPPAEEEPAPPPVSPSPPATPTPDPPPAPPPPDPVEFDDSG